MLIIRLSEIIWNYFVAKFGKDKNLSENHFHGNFFNYLKN